jgi:hypothetical protein
MSLAAAAGWSPRSLEEVLCRSCTPGGHGCCATADAGRVSQSHEACQLLGSAAAPAAPAPPAAAATTKPVKTSSNKAKAGTASVATQSSRWTHLSELLAK